MAREIVSTPKARSPPPTYSQAVNAGGLVFVSNPGRFDAAPGKVVGATIREQCRQCLTVYVDRTRSFAAT